MTFSSSAELSISLGSYRHMSHSGDHVTSFRNAVDRIRFIGSGTRIDIGLNVVKNSLFSYYEVCTYLLCNNLFLRVTLSYSLSLLS